MKIAYIILAHKYPEQLTRLIKRLDSDNTSFFVHVDKKTTEADYRKILDLRIHENIHFIKRYKTNWGSFGQIQATLKGIQVVLASSSPCDYAFLLTGQDYPIKSSKDISNFLLQNPGRLFMDYHTYPQASKLDLHLRYWHFMVFGQHIVFPKEGQFKNPVFTRLWNGTVRRIPLRRKLPSGMIMYKGSQFWCLSRDCLEYIDRFTRENPRFTNFFKRAFIPDEKFFQIILLNSPFRDQIVNDDLHYIDWTGMKTHPRILGIEDFDNLMKTKALFARKFDITVDKEILNKIDEAIKER